MLDLTAPQQIRPIDTRQHVKIFVLLMVASALASVATLPYAAVITRQDPSTALTWPSIVGAVISNMILIAPLSALGLWLGGKIGLGAPALAAWLAGEAGAGRRLRSVTLLGGVVGFVLGGVVLVLAATLAPLLPEMEPIPAPPWWYGLLVAYGAGVNEELMLRLGLMTILAWAGTRLTGAGSVTPAVAWTANVLTALAFGALHLPLASVLAPLTAIMVVRTIGLNALVGVAFGWLYWRHGLLAAIVAHIAVDIVLHVLSWLITPMPTP